ncbi:MAG: hypothetical protein WEE89_15305 [Gemmatimonadota bacterium]
MPGRRRRWYHFEGSLGGLRYQAHFGMIDLTNLTEKKRQVHELPVHDRARANALQVWESEGGALLQVKH